MYQWPVEDPSSPLWFCHDASVISPPDESSTIEVSSYGLMKVLASEEIRLARLDTRRERRFGPSGNITLPLWLTEVPPRTSESSEPQSDATLSYRVLPLNWPVDR